MHKAIAILLIMTTIGGSSIGFATSTATPPTSTPEMELSNSDSTALPMLINATPKSEIGIEKGISAMYGASLPAGIIVAGGCNFPATDPLAPDAVKQYYKGIYLWPKNTGADWEKVAELPEACAYGASFASGNRLVIMGGTTADGNMTDVVSVSLSEKGDEPQVKVIGELPFAIDNCGFCSDQGKGYLVGGNIDGVPSNRVTVYDLDSGAFTELPPMPGNPRVQPIAAVAAGKLFVWGGFAGKHNRNDATLELGGLAFDFTSGEWSEIAGPVDPEGNPLSVGGGAIATMPNGRLLVCGGVNKDIFLSALQNQAPDYLHHPIEWYRFNPYILLFDAVEGKWSVAGKSALCARAGALLLNYGADSALLFGGEVKPRVRTPQSVILEI